MRNKQLDQNKFIMAILVIFLHAPVPGVVGEIIGCIARISVPFFFMVSGYYSSEKKSDEYLKKIKKTACLLAYSIVIYFVWNILVSSLQDGLKNFLYECFSIKNLVEMILFNAGSLLGHLWFVAALLYCYIFCYIFSRTKISKRAIVGTTCALLIGHFLIRSVLELFQVPDPTKYVRGFLFTGLPFFLIGQLTTSIIQTKTKRKTVVLGLLAFLGGGLSLVETFFIWKCDLYVGTVVCSVCIFIITQLNPECAIDLFCILGKRYSTDLYIWHVLIISITNIFSVIIGVYGNNYYKLLLPIIVVAGTLIFAIGKGYILKVIYKKRKGYKEG